MSSPLDTIPTALHPHALPDDPDPGQKFVLRNGESLGGASVLHVFLKGELIGSLNRVVPIVNVSRKYSAERVAVSHQLKRNTLIRIRALQYGFTEITFIEYFGWVGTKTTKPIVLSDKFYRVLEAIPVGMAGNNAYLYEKLCLQSIDTKGEQP